MTEMKVSRVLRPLGSTMQAIRFHTREDLRLDEVPVPDPQPGELRICPLAVGICGTDAHIFHGEFPVISPRVLGHEIAGVVEAVGAGVKAFREGDFVTVQPNTYCGACRYCRLGREHLCPNMWAYGVHGDGGFAEAMGVMAKAVYHLPADLEARVACLAEPLACCIHGMDLLSVQSGATVLVIGAGLIGLMLTRLARLSGAGLIVSSEPNVLRRANALAFGADRAMDPNEPNWREALADATHGFGFDAVIDAVGSAATFEQAISAAARGGTVLVFGVAPMQATASVRPYDLFQRELTVVGSFVNPYTHERAVSLLPQMGLEKLRIEAYSLVDFRKAFEAQATTSAAAKVEILPQQ
jgi:2-desacetyl-2-hydroxyethyl bacteriochlorophyllide A dehydrogenase